MIDYYSSFTRIVTIGVIIIDFLAYIFAMYKSSSDYSSPYGRELFKMAANFVDRNDLIAGISPYLRGR